MPSGRTSATAPASDIFYSRRTAAEVWSMPNLKVSDDPGGGGGAVQCNPRIAGTAAGGVGDLASAITPSLVA